MKPNISFAQYTLEQRPIRLREGNRIVHLSSRQLGVLKLIVEAAGDTVTKETFFDQVWNGSFVEEGNLTQTVFILRKALGRLPNGGEMIEVVPRKGYRLTAAALKNDVWGPYTPRQVDVQALDSRMYSEDLFRLMVDTIEDYAIYVLDCAGRVVTWPKGAEKNEGYTADEVLGEHHSMFFLPQDIEARVPDHELAIAARRGRCVGEDWRIRKNGERFWASFVVTPMRQDGGKILGYVEVVRDLTEKKREEDALLRAEASTRRERDRLAAAAESSAEAFCICDAVRDQKDDIEDFVITYMNGNAERLLSTPRLFALSRKLGDLPAMCWDKEIVAKLRQVVVTGKSYTEEFEVKCGLLTASFLRLRAVPLWDGVAVSLLDISEIKKQERRLVALAELDALTGLPRGISLPEVLMRAVDTAVDSGTVAGLMIFDFDNFRQINNELGYCVGDAVLETLGPRLKEILEPGQAAFRYGAGGDSFSILFTGVETEGKVLELAQGVIEKVQRPMMVSGRKIQLTCSSGGSSFPGTANSAEQLLAQADIALCAAKWNGGGRHQQYAADMKQTGQMRGRSRVQSIDEVTEPYRITPAAIRSPRAAWQPVSPRKNGHIGVVGSLP